MSNGVDKVDSWLRAIAMAGKATRITLRHIDSNHRPGDMIHEGPVEYDASWVDKTRDLINNAVSLDVEGIGGVQSYVLRAFSAEKKNAGPRLEFKATPEEEGGDLTTEGPTSAGLTAQAMRHSEAFARQMTQGLAAMIGHMSSTIEIQGRTIADLTARQMAQIRDIAEFAEAKAEHEIELKAADARADAIRSIGEAGRLLLPAVAAKLQGKPDAITKHFVKSFAESMSQEQVNSLLSDGSIKLSPIQQQVLIGALNHVADDKSGTEKGD